MEGVYCFNALFTHHDMITHWLDMLYLGIYCTGTKDQRSTYSTLYVAALLMDQGEQPPQKIELLQTPFLSMALTFLPDFNQSFYLCSIHRCTVHSLCWLSTWVGQDVALSTTGSHKGHNQKPFLDLRTQITDSFLRRDLFNILLIL